RHRFYPALTLPRGTTAHGIGPEIPAQEQGEEMRSGFPPAPRSRTGTGSTAVKKSVSKFACLALAVLGTGALVLASTPLDAKGGGGGGHGGGASMRGGMARASFRPAPRPNIGPLSQRGYPIARNIGPLSGRYLASRHGGHHPGHGHRWGNNRPHY